MLAGAGLLKPTDIVIQEGMGRWLPAESVDEIFPPASVRSAPTERVDDGVSRFMTRAKCSLTGNDLSIQFRKDADGNWCAVKAFRRSGDGIDERYPAYAFHGAFYSGEHFGGCPYCHCRDFYKCGCGTMNCLGGVRESHEGLICVCHNCGASGAIGGSMENVRGASET
jgi:hypothetical protein